MKCRIAIWATLGALVVVGWSLYIYAISPIALARRYPLSFYFVLLANAATYALVGVLVETIRRHYQTRSLSN
jgi:hypothetical protein